MRVDLSTSLRLYEPDAYCTVHRSALTSLHRRRDNFRQQLRKRYTLRRAPFFAVSKPSINCRTRH